MELKHPIYVFDKNDTLKATLMNEQPGACWYMNDKHHEILSYTLSTYTFDCDGTHTDATYLENKSLVVIRNNQGVYIPFRIEQVTEDPDQGTKQVYAENAALELLGKLIRPISVSSNNAKYHLDYVLNGQRWQAGVIEDTSLQDIVYDGYMTVLGGIQKIASTFGLEIQYRVELSGNQITGWFIDLVKQRGRNIGRILTYKKDIQGFTRITSTKTLMTSIVPLGKNDNNGDPLTIKDVVWSKVNGDPADKPSGQDWIGDPIALQLWGVKGRHIEGKFENSNISDPSILIQKGWDELQKNIASSQSYKVDVAYLDDDAGLGDTYRIKDTRLNPEVLISARIVEFEFSYSDKTQNTVTIGDYIQIVSNTPAIVKSLVTTTNQHIGLINGKAEVYVGTSAPTNTNQFWLDSSQTPNIWKRWDETTSTWIKATPTKALELKYSTGDTVEGLKPAQAGADVTNQNTAADTAKVAGTTASAVRDNASNGAAAKTKIDSDVGSNTIETTTGSQSKADTAKTSAISSAATDATTKANTAETNAKGYTDNQLTSYVQAVTYNQKVSDLQSQIDGNITSWFYNYDPTLSNAPISTWTDNTTKDNHLGDLFYNTSSGYGWRFTKDTGTGVYSWTQVKDTDIQKALQEASTAQDTADSKRRVFVSQPVPPYDVGDLWDDNSSVWRAATAKATGTAFSQSNWVKIGDVTSSNTAADTTKVNGVPASTVSTQAGNSVQKGTALNGITFTEANGQVVTRSDGLVQVILSATNGILIQGRATTSDAWQNVFYIDTKGNGYFAGDIEGSTITGSTFSTTYDSSNPNAPYGFTELSSEELHFYEKDIDNTVSTEYNQYYFETILEMNRLFMSEEQAGQNQDYVELTPSYLKFFGTGMNGFGNFEIAVNRVTGETTITYDKLTFQGPINLHSLLFDTDGSLDTINAANKINVFGTYMWYGSAASVIQPNGMPLWIGYGTGQQIQFRDEVQFVTPPYKDGWTGVSFLNGWVNYGAAFYPAAYQKDPFGYVRLRGLIKSGSANTVAFTLPAGYRPSHSQGFSCADGSGGSKIYISNNGDVTVVSYSSYTFLDNISFEAVQ